MQHLRTVQSLERHAAQPHLTTPQTCLKQPRMPRVRTVATALGGLCCAWFLFVHPFLPRGYFAYSTRPLWDRDEAPQQVLRQYWTPDLAPADRCRLHGWTARDQETQVWDAVRARQFRAVVMGS